MMKVFFFSQKLLGYTENCLHSDATDLSYLQAAVLREHLYLRAPQPNDYDDDTQFYELIECPSYLPHLALLKVR